MPSQETKVAVTPPRHISLDGSSSEYPPQYDVQTTSSARNYPYQSGMGSAPHAPYGRFGQDDHQSAPSWGNIPILLGGPFGHHPKHSSLFFDDQNRRTAKEVSHLTGADLTELQIILSADFPLLSWPPRLSETEAIEQLRSLNGHPELTLSQNRLAALERVRHALVTNEELQNAPIQYIAAGLFPDLDTGLFDNRLFRRVFIGESDYADGVARTDMVGARGLRISLSTPFYDREMKDKPAVVRIKDAVTSLIHEMCHAYIKAHCGWRVCEDVVYCGRGGQESHGIYFGQVLHLVQKVLDFVDWRIDLGENGRYPMYELRRVPRGGPEHIDQEPSAGQGTIPSDLTES